MCNVKHARFVHYCSAPPSPVPNIKGLPKSRDAVNLITSPRANGSIRPPSDQWPVDGSRFSGQGPSNVHIANVGFQGSRFSFVPWPPLGATGALSQNNFHPACFRAGQGGRYVPFCTLLRIRRRDTLGNIYFPLQERHFRASGEGQEYVIKSPAGGKSGKIDGNNIFGIDGAAIQQPDTGAGHSNGGADRATGQIHFLRRIKRQNQLPRNMCRGGKIECSGLLHITISPPSLLPLLGQDDLAGLPGFKNPLYVLQRHCLLFRCRQQRG